MSSVVDICNSALNQIGASNIISLTEDSKSARILNQRFNFVRDSVFRAHPWNCLTIRVVLSPDATPPAFGFDNAFTLPTDPFCLRVLNIRFFDIVHRVEGRKILCDEDTIELTYIGRITDVSQYDMLLVEMRLLYERKLSEARLVDATEGTPQTIGSTTDAGGLEPDAFVRSRF